jgi:hypothetical protein
MVAEGPPHANEVGLTTRTVSMMTIFEAVKQLPPSTV